MEISVIIPVYNTEKYLTECLDSLIAQDFKDWECILVNDGSTDQSGLICDQYAQADKRFRVFHTKNSGVSIARNTGITHASGKYITFIDSDDMVDNTYLTHLYEGMMESKADLVVCGLQRLLTSGEIRKLSAQGRVQIGSENTDLFVELHSKFLLYGPVVKLYHTHIIKDQQIRFPEGIHFGEDLIFNLAYMSHINTIFAIDSTGYKYRIQDEGNLSSSPHSRNLGINYQQWKMIRSSFEKRGIDSRASHTYLSNRLWGIVYNFVMNNKLRIGEIRTGVNKELIADLCQFDMYTITVPAWLKSAILKRRYFFLWLIQRRSK